MDKYLGKRLEGRYDILELIGSGGMANVYRAFDIIDERTVAVKILRDEYIGNNEFIRRFKNESKAIALLNHPNIVRVYDVSFTDSTHSIVMEYIDGVTLKEFIQHKKVLSSSEAIHFVMQILNALQHAHDKGIVHRDIKPQNIMLLRNGQIKVTDFGIARFARSEVRTITDRAIGSVHYISPEQAMGENTDDKSDIYSVGVLLYEMLTGELPFEADSAVSVAIKQVQNEAKKPSEVNPDIPHGLEEITLKAMRKIPNERYQSAAEMIADINAFHTNPSIVFGYDYGRKAETAKRSNPSGGQKMKPKKKTPFLKMLTLTTLFVCIGTLGFVGLMLYLNNPFEKTPEIDNPNLVGEKLEDVEKRHYAISLATEMVYNEKPYGVIIEQNPRAGISIKEGATIKVVVSKGLEDITIPDFIGLPSSRASSEMRDMGLVPVESENRAFDDDVPAGCIISLEPSPGTVVPSGTEILVVVSKGTETIPLSVPSLVGLPLDSAKRIIEANKFTIGSITTKPSELPENTVISQTPNSGSFMLENDKINLVVSEGGLQSYSIRIPLPQNINRTILVRARTGEKYESVAGETTLNPAESSSGAWNPTFTGQPGDNIIVTIFIEGELYQQYHLDFDSGESVLVRDRSNEDLFQS